LPSSEVAVLTAMDDAQYKNYMLCDYFNAFLKEIKKHKILCSAIDHHRRESITFITIPGEGRPGI